MSATGVDVEVAVDPVTDVARPGLAGNALGMLAGRMASMALGFLFWLVAARAADATEVGLTSAVVASMMLCTQLAQLGIGAAFIAAYPEEQRRPAELLDTAVSLSALGALLSGGVFLLVAGVWFDELGTVAGSAGWVLLFLAMAVLGTANIVLDHVSMALGRGHQVLTRNVAFGLVALGVLAVLAVRDVRVTALELFSAWVLAGVVACAIGLGQLWVGLDHYRLRLRVARRLGRRLVGVGLANHALTLCERVPGLVLPVVVTEVLSPETNAYWYVVWMTAWVVFIAPVSVGIALFADAAHRPAALARSTTHALRTSLLLGGGGAVVLAIVAEPVLGLMGGSYAEEGVTPLRVLLLAVLPLAVVTAYYAQCRAQERWREALLTGAAAALVGVVATAVAGAESGLVGMAVTWVVTQTLVAGWAGTRLWSAR